MKPTIKLDIYKLQRIYEMYGEENGGFEHFLLTLCNDRIISINDWLKCLNYYKKTYKGKITCNQQINYI